MRELYRQTSRSVKENGYSLGSRSGHVFVVSARPIAEWNSAVLCYLNREERLTTRNVDRFKKRVISWTMVFPA